ncbi:MAG: terminase family protein [Armatimonadetes bacterium]|nr:terminase family protein [Armatimonadota bacterium]
MTRSRKRLLLAKLLWGWEPHGTQKTWLLDESQTKVAACGRRWGKTESAAIDAATTAIMCRGSVQMIVSPTYDQSRLISDAVERFLLGSPVTRKLTRVVKTPYPRITIGGSLIMARTADDDGRNLRGHAADRVIVDEAAYVRDSVVQEVITPMLADRGGQLVMISTPFGKNHFYRLFLRGQATSENLGPRIRSFQFPSWLNPHISRDYVEAQRLELSPRQFAVEYEAKFLEDQASVFAWDDIEAAAECSLADSHREPGFECVVAGIDWARYSDYTALVALGVGEHRLSVIAIERFNGVCWQNQVERASEFLRRHRVMAVLTDQTSIGDPLLEQLRQRLYELGVETCVEGFVFTNQSKRELIELLALQFARRAITIPRDEALMRELQYFEYELTGYGKVRMQARPGFYDDLVMALALACRQARAFGAGGGYLTAGNRAACDGW